MVFLDYNNWPFARQLRINLIFFSVLVCLALILITWYQLRWLKDDISSDYSNLLTHRLSTQMECLVHEEGEYIAQELSNFIEFVDELNNIEKLILGLTNVSEPIIPGPPVQHYEYAPGEFDYTHGAFMSSYSELSDEAIELEKKQAAMDFIYPLISEPNYLFIYSGFEIDEIIQFYPGGLMGSPTYSPIVREWYYKAKDNQPITIITEPYVDAITYYSVVTVSKAILKESGEFIGVSASDVTLNELTTRTSKIKILENGFLMLVSSGGMVLTFPESWNLTLTEPLKIFDEDISGISMDFWQEILSSPDETTFQYTRLNITYILIKYTINPYKDINHTTHFLLAFADKNEIVAPVESFSISYVEAYTMIFIIVTVIAAIVFFFIAGALQLTTNSLSKKLKMVKKIFAKISQRALLPEVTRNISFNEIERNRKGIESLVMATKIKVNRIRDTEERYSYFQWNMTRPNEKFYFNRWLNVLYPFNLYNSKAMSWRKSFSILQSERVVN